MDKLKVFQIATIGLLLLNIMLVAFIFFAPRPGGAPPLRAGERFGFDEAQNEQFLNLARTHQGQMRAANDQQTELLQTYFRQLTTDNAEKPGPLPAEIASLEAEKINSTYQHFLDIKKMLRPEQQAAFPSFVNDALERILLKTDKNKRPPPKD